MFISFIRTVIFYFALIIFLRIMGKRQIGELQPSEFAVTLLIADLAAIPLQNGSIPLANGFIPIAALLILEMVISLLTLKSRKLRTIISGHPLTVIENGKIMQDTMKKLRFNTDDLCEGLRLQGITDIGQVEYAVIETNGQMSVFTKNDDSLFFTVVTDGKLDTKPLKRLNISEKKIMHLIKAHGYRSEKEVFLMCINKNGKVFIEGKK